VELKAGIAEVKADILNWAVGAIGFQTAVILGAIGCFGTYALTT
jgi:hypothetical protein